MNAPEEKAQITTDTRARYAMIAAVASLVTVSVLVMFKSVAYIESGATSVLASLIDSVVDAAASLVTLFAIRLSIKPADHEHRHGHGKIEGLSALLQAAFIGGAGALLLLESMLRFINPRDVTDHMMAISVMGVSIVLSLLLVMIQKYALRRTPSLAIEADMTHYGMDIIVNIGTILILIALFYGAPSWADPVFAVLVAFYLAMTARDVGGKAIDMLLDKELSGDTREKILTKVLAQEGVMGLHDLRTKQSGMQIFISFDIAVKADLLLSEAHAIARDVEFSLLADFPHAEIMIHVDPHNDTEDTRHKIAGVHH